MRISDWSSDVCSSDLVGRHLAGTEAGHAHLRGNALDLGIDTLVDVLGGDGQRVGALQALVQRLDSLHSLEALAWKNRMCAAFGRRIWCGRRDSNPHILRYRNLNPARLQVPPRQQRSARGRRESVV